MTNEEIYKLSRIRFRIDKKEDAIIKRLFLGLCGFVIMLTPVLLDFGKNIYYSDTRYLLCIILALLFSVLLMIVTVKVANPIEIEYRNYFANLVRADERKRCMTKMERYEHEGSR